MSETTKISALEDIRSHLRAAVAQSVFSDDKIIMDHVRAALVCTDGLWKDMRHIHQASGNGDLCGLCSKDIRNNIHVRAARAKEHVK